ncbi:DoxX family membrane protein [Halobacteria archaeon AArc-m2/3/4]|uniref:DoxX family membrane protein n=1 Tax=Natronoglomus mannanivorans TaxID=2979990 RepID=A0AAP3E3T4_9EURY|nr:DoxX family membrane protein [Halobacteria archaeon AArc-xg1-1]MCU4974656.1 DoxX family membrane protein [Halobacteria archaeon AArc-m2/3/4]
MSTNTRNRLESQYAGFTLEGTPHALSAWFVVALRFLLGGMMLFAGIGKYTGEAFDASGFLVHGVDPASPVSGLYATMAGNAALLEVINVVIPLTQVLIGVALIAGGFLRLAALGGALQMVAFYLGGWEGEILALFDSTLIYAVLFLALAAFGAGRILGADRYIEQLKVGSETLVEKYPKLRYILG